VRHKAHIQGATLSLAGGTIFHEPWWLDAATADWQQVEVRWDGKVVGWLPFAATRRYGSARIEMPPYARVLGPVLTLPSSKPVTRFANVRSVIASLIAKLPRHDTFNQVLPPGSEQGIAFALNGWTVEETYTFRVAPGASPDAAWDAMGQKTRNVLRTAQSRMMVEQHGDLDRYIALSRAQFRLQGRADGHRYDVLSRVFAACAERGRSTILTARNERGRDAASAALLWDDETLYFWTAARDLATAGNGAYSLVVWDALRLALERGLAFDFDGFPSPAAGLFVASFGGTPAVRPRVVHRALLPKLGALAREATQRAQRS
jgi:hypothetical protein